MKEQEAEIREKQEGMLSDRMVREGFFEEVTSKQNLHKELHPVPRS